MVLLHPRIRPWLQGYAAPAARGRFYTVRARRRAFQLMFACRDLGVLAPCLGGASRKGIVCDDNVCPALGLYDDEARYQGGRARPAAVTCAEPRIGVAHDGGRIRDDASSVLLWICRGL